MIHISIIMNVDADNSNIDINHLKLYPYCGSMNGAEQSTASGRISNTKAAEIHYRWVVKVVRSNMNTQGNLDETTCTGSIITDR